MATRLNPTNFGYQNFYSALLTADITSGSLTISLDTVPSPTSGILVIDPDSSTGREVILYTSKGASTITCPSDGRGYSGSTAAAHLTGTTVIMAPIDKWFTALASGELSTDPLRTELFFDYVVSGIVWSGDSYGSTRNASMTSGVVYINGRRLTVSSVTARSFTASKDTYIDVTDSAGDGTGTLVYTEVANNAASPALAANSVRLGIIVTGASNIANAGSVNQGEETKLLPIASSVPYTFTDSLGNLICPRDPNRRVIGLRQTLTTATTSSTSAVAIPDLSIPVIIPANRKVKVSLLCYAATAASGNYAEAMIYTGASLKALTTKIASTQFAFTTGGGYPAHAACTITLPAGLTYITGAVISSTASAMQLYAGANTPITLIVELI